MKKYILICALTSLSILSKAQEADSVAKKISKLPFNEWEVYPRCTEGSIEEYISNNFKRPKSLKSDFDGNIVASILIDRKGNYRDIELLKMESKELDQETLRVLSSVKWVPAVYDFATVNFNLVMDIRIHYDILTRTFKVDTYTHYNPRPADRKGVVDSINVDVLPSFPGGQNAFNEYLKKNLTYPQSAKRHHIQDLILISFTVETDGSMTNFHVAGSPDYELALQSLRVLKQCPQFIPASAHGKPVRCAVTIPINFQLINNRYFY